MPAYVVVSLEVTDPEAYQSYLPGAGAAIVAHGGRLLAADPGSAVLEGEPRPVTVVIEFSDKATADAWYHSDAYQSVAPIRQGATQGTMVIADGFVPPGA